MINNPELKEILKTSVEPSVVCEIYPANVSPGASGFNPADALKRFSNVSGITFLGLEYEKLVASYGKIKRTISPELNRASVEFVNLSNEISRFEFASGFEGLIKVIRFFDRAKSTSLEKSLILSVGRCEKPTSGTKEKLSVTAKQVFGAISAEIPRRKFTAEDANGRVSSDPDFEGFIYIPQYGTSSYNTRQRRGGLLGFLGFKKTITTTLPWSSFSDLDASRSVPYVFGRSQLSGIHLGYADVGSTIRLLTAFCEGEIADLVNVRSVNPQFPLDAVNFQKLLGKKGIANGLPDYNWVAPGYYSRTAHTRSQANNSLVSETDAAPDEVAVIFGLLMPIPNAALTDFSNFGWTDSAAAITRFVLTDKELSKLDAAWIDDKSFIEVFKTGDEFIFDSSYSDILFLPAGAADPGNGYASTGAASPDYFNFKNGETSPSQAFAAPPAYQTYNLDILPIDPPGGGGGGGGGGIGGGGTGSAAGLNFYLRRRYTCNLVVTETIKITDFLHEVVFPSARLYLAPNEFGQIQLKQKKPVDWALGENAYNPGANSIKVDDVSKWIADKSGFLLIDPHTNKSEIKIVTAAFYSADQNNTAMSASASLSVSAFSGGDANNPATARITINHVAASNYFVLDGIRIDFSTGGGDSLSTVAGFIYAAINAHPTLRRRFSANWNPGAVFLTITAKFGTLGFSENLLLDHSAPLANPAAAPVLSIVAGNKRAGKYLVSYTFRNGRGETLLSPSAEITLNENENISVGKIFPPAGNSVNWYISPEAKSTKLRYFLNNAGEAFTVADLPYLSAPLPPDLNRTGCEVLRVAAVFSNYAEPRTSLKSANVFTSSYKWMLGDRESSTNEIKLKFRDATQDWKLVELTLRDDAHIKKTKTTSAKEINGQAIDNYNQAYRIASGLLAEYRDADFFYKWASDRENLLLQEGDVVAVTDSGAEVVNFPVSIEDLDIDPETGFPSVDFTARKYSTTLYDDSVAERKIPIIPEPNPAYNAPVFEAVVYKPSNFLISRAFNAATATNDEIKNTLATVMDDLQNKRK